MVNKKWIKKSKKFLDKKRIPYTVEKDGILIIDLSELSDKQFSKLNKYVEKNNKLMIEQDV